MSYYVIHGDVNLGKPKFKALHTKHIISQNNNTISKINQILN